MDFLVPKLSATMEQATVLRWLKRPGEPVKMGEALVEIETDKAAMEVEAPVDATLDEVLAPEGAALPIGGLLARLTPIGQAKAAAAAAGPSFASASATQATPAPAATAPVTAPKPRRVPASPLARRLASERGLELAALAGTGPGGRVRKRDVLAAATSAPAAVAAAAAHQAPLAPVAGAVPLTPMRARIAESVALSRRTIPAFALDRWVETTGLDAARALLDPEIERETRVKPTVTDFLLQAMADAIGGVPGITDRLVDGPGGPARLPAASVDIGLVVAVPDGLMIPVLRDLAGRSLAEIAQARQDAVQRVRAGRLSAADSEPPAITLSNLGQGGADRFEAIISPGQSSILAVGRAHERVIARGGAIAIARGVHLTYSVDHRLIDGVRGASFLGLLAERIERGPWTPGGRR